MNSPASIPIPLLVFGVALLPVLIALLCRLLPQVPQASLQFRTGNPLLSDQRLPRQSAPLLQSYAQAARLHRHADLADLVTGMRHLPLKETAPVLRRFQKSLEPSLELHAQSILQTQQESLQATFARLLPAANESNEAKLASYLEAGLSLLSSPQTQESEHPAIVNKLSAVIASTTVAKSDHPRLLYNAALVCLRELKLAEARTFLLRLPAGCPLHANAAAKLVHAVCVHHPPQPLTAGYSIQ